MNDLFVTDKADLDYMLRPYYEGAPILRGDANKLALESGARGGDIFASPSTGQDLDKFILDRSQVENPVGNNVDSMMDPAVKYAIKMQQLENEDAAAGEHEKQLESAYQFYKYRNGR